MDLIIPDWPGIPSNIGALTTARRGGFSQPPYDDGAGAGGLNVGLHVQDDVQTVTRNRQLLNTILPAEAAWLSQVHGVTVVDAATARNSPEADASIGTEPGIVCAIQTADCLPVLFCDVAGKVVGAAHAGWRGLLHGVLQNTVEQMRKAGAGEISAWLGPAIGPQRFEVGVEVMQAFVEHDPDTAPAFVTIENIPGKYLTDIYQLARYALTKAEVSKVYGGGYCTVTDRNTFYSYRRDRTTGRMASLIWIK
jgi:YfiH family protein